MALAAEGNSRALVNDRKSASTGTASLMFRVVLGVILITAASNCFLKYLWWTAYSSTLNGIPKVYAQWQAASTRATFYGWSLILLDAAAVLLLYTAIRFRQTDALRKTARLIVSLIITVMGTGVLALLLSLVKQS
jgi:glucan phosphoethanolaminetransferase (alkaline phosphatase superfamily)